MREDISRDSLCVSFDQQDRTWSSEDSPRRNWCARVFVRWLVIDRRSLSPARREKWGTVEVWYFIGLLCNSSQCGCVSRWPPLKYPQVLLSNSKQCDNGILWAPTFRLLRSQVHILSNQWHSGTDRNISRPTSLGTELIVSLSRNPVVVT